MEFLEKNHLLGSDSGENKFFVSGEPESFKKLAVAFLEKEITSEVQKIDIEKLKCYEAKKPSPL